MGGVPKKQFSKLTVLAFAVWFLCVVAVFSIIGYLVGVRNETFDIAPISYTISLLAFMALGVLAFVVGILSLAIQILRSREKKQNPFIFLIKLFFVLLIFPVFLFFHILRSLSPPSKKSKVKIILQKLALVLSVVLMILPIWVGGYVATGVLVANRLGYVTEEINIVGTGSMYPTWEKGTKGKSHKELANEIITTAGFLPYPNGIVIGGRRLFGHMLGRGDIITWENDVTRELTSRDGAEPAGLLKRVIGLPGDTIELRDGIVYLNGEAQKEPYIAKSHSTFGGNFLKECQVVTVPEGNVFAMGDNRKGSADSREIGFAPIQDIYRVLPLEDQIGSLDKNWHDATNDLSDSTKPKIDREKFVELLNEKRREKGVPELKYQTKLEKSAELRGEVILKEDDFEQKSSYTMERAMADAGYWNSLWWEVSIQGYYEAEEIIEDYLERDWTDAKETWFDSDFDDIGIAEVEGELNGCPTQVIVIHIAGYIPPNYKQEDIDSWKTVLSQLQEIQPGWQSLKDYPEFYEKNKNDIDRINEIIATRISNISKIVSKMEANQWLSASEQNMVKQDIPLHDEQESIANRLNSR